MKRVEQVLKKNFNLKVRRIVDKNSKDIVVLELPEFGILITKDSTLMDNRDYRCILVNEERLDDQVYLGSLNKEILWNLIESGYLRKLRLEYPGAFKAIIVKADWGRKIINRRLEKLEDKPKHRFERKMNEDYKKEFVRSFMEDPGFFDKL
jgi:hypothetical protein